MAPLMAPSPLSPSLLEIKPMSPQITAAIMMIIKPTKINVAILLSSSSGVTCEPLGISPSVVPSSATSSASTYARAYVENLSVLNESVPYA